MTTAARTVVQRAMRAYDPPPDIRVSEWAAAERVVARGTSARSGRWRSEPYQDALMDAVHEAVARRAEAVVLMKSARVGATEMLLNIVGYFVAHDPKPIMLLEPTESLAKRISKRRLGPMIAAAPALARRIHSGRGRHPDSTLLHKRFPGGDILLVGANSPTPLSSDAICVLLADEIDKYPTNLGDEGDPLSLARKRTATYWDAVRWYTSTPTLQGESEIEKWYALSDQRRFVVPCPRCGHEDFLTWDDQRHFWVRFSGRDPATAHLVCPACAGRLEDHERQDMLRQGRWVATAPYVGVIGFHAWEAYASWARLATMVANWLRAVRLGQAQVREFHNQTLGRPFELPGSKVDASSLLGRREPYPHAREGYVGDLPAQVCGLTAGVDTQDDRLELHVWGYAPGEESWLVDVQIIPGDPARPEPWQELDRLLTRSYRHATGVSLPILATCIDSGGHRTQHVYDYCRRPASIARRVYCIKGQGGPDIPFVGDHRPRRYGQDEREVNLHLIGTDQGNALLTPRLLQAAAGPGYVHLPIGHHHVGEEYVAQLAGMRLTLKQSKGKPSVRVWEAIRPRVEAFDAALYALAALRLADPRGDQLTAWAGRVAAAAADLRHREAEPAAEAAPPQPAAGRPVGRSSYLAGHARGSGW